MRCSSLLHRRSFFVGSAAAFRSAILEQHRAECEANHMYVEAEVATRRLQELRAHEVSDQAAESDRHLDRLVVLLACRVQVKRRKEAYRSRHIAEKLDVEEAHLLEIEVTCKSHPTAVFAQTLLRMCRSSTSAGTRRWLRTKRRAPRRRPSCE